MTRRKPKQYQLKATTFKNLPQNWQTTIKKLKSIAQTLGKASRETEITDKFIKNLINTLYKLKETLQTVSFTDTQEIAKHLKSHREATGVLSKTLRLKETLYGGIVELICGLTKNDYCTNAQDLIDNVENLSEEEADQIALLLMKGDDEPFQFSAEVGGTLPFYVDELNQFIKHLTLLHGAVQHFQIQRLFLAKIGPCQIYLDRGPFDSVPEKIIEDNVKMTLDGIADILIRYKQAGVPDYALAGDVVLELGLPPLKYGGQYDIIENSVRITLKNYKNNIRLSANYEAEAYEQKADLMSVVFGKTDRDAPETFFDIPVYFTIAHELAHRIYYRGLRPKAKQAWEDIYATTTISPEEAILLEEYYQTARTLEKNKTAFGQFLQGEGEMANYAKNLIRKTEQRLAKIKSTLPAELQSIINEIKKSPYSDLIDHASFSKIMWPTKYAQVNESEAFAEAVIMVLWEHQGVANHRRKNKISAEEWQKFKDLVWYFIRSLRPQKLRR